MMEYGYIDNSCLKMAMQVPALHAPVNVAPRLNTRCERP